MRFPPGMLNSDFIQRKIKLIQEDLAKLETIAGYSFDQLARDPLKYGASERFLERIITRAIDINRHCIAELGKGTETVRSYEDTFLRMADLKVYPEDFARKIAPSAGLRNVLVHEYDEVDPKLVFKSVGYALTQYAKYCDYLLKFLKRKR
ncbi:hypothetical protein A3F28_00975 [Candidatus Uhrbacteria bacterium RIFCSPHIGHO2_12_FULL_57_11]|uniref:DUF86 domain-containing protein n=2 Tax=Candidatus Uhriibacteriota TaxID=1752732 RepID=A0A1F7UHL6_9BACT|nr:MAG: hypothetical protein A3F28_00975 [Candidatus Uhrbacteria bacterium RIFCSPHIGHO2_12_FULL_57_11]